MSYIETHSEELELEYQAVLHQAEETRQYWEEINREHLASIANLPPKPEFVSAWEKLQVRKARRAALNQ